MAKPKALSINELADKIRLAVRLAKDRQGKHRSDTAAFGLTLVEQLKLASAANRYEPWLIFLHRTTGRWKQLLALQRELEQLKTTGASEQNGT